MKAAKAFLVAIFVPVALTTGPPAPQPGTQQLDTAALTRTEELSESLANDLLALSVAARDKDRPGIERYFADPLLATPLPTLPTPEVPRLKWIADHGWRAERPATDPAADPSAPDPAAIHAGQLHETSRGAFVAGLEALLEHFVSIEDVRFKVKAADFSEASESVRGTARIWFYVVGREPEGRREWLTGWANVEARHSGNLPIPTDAAAGAAAGEGPGPAGDAAEPTEPEPWQIDRFALESIESMVATTDIFSEIAIPAGVHTDFPPFGTAPNDTVVAHGVAVADVDGDGLLDVVTTGVESNKLYLNDGAGGFRDVSAESYVELAPPGTGPLFVDFDNDSDQDLFMAAVGAQILLENRLVPDGELRFVDRSLEALVAIDAVGFSAAAADVNGDGFQDIYVSSYNRYGLVMPNSWNAATNGTPNLLFVNQRDGTFREEGAARGVRDERWSYAASFADVDGDGDQDLYVSNDFGENGFYLNEGGRFREVAAERGVIDPGNGMGVAFGDYDNDGDLDLHVTNMSSTAGNRILSRLYPDADPADLVLKKLAAGNSLYANDGTGSFTDATAEAGGLSAGWAFGGGFVDFDNDGWEDIYSPNGFISGKTMNDT